MHWTYGLWYWKSIQRSVSQLTRDFKPDVVLGYWAHPDGYAAIKAADLLGAPSAIMVGGSDIRILAKSGLRRKAIQSVLKQTGRVIAFSHDLAKHVEELGVPRNRIDVVYRGVDRTIFFKGPRLEARQRLSLDDGLKLLVWIGRLVDVKNPSMAIQAATKWKQVYGDRFRLVMIGEGPLGPSLERLSERLGVRQHVDFLGSIPQLKIADWFRAANATILTSLSEGVPNVLLESAACGTPFIATDVGGVREIANTQTDRLVASGDIAALQEAVIEKLASPQDGSSSGEESGYDVFELSRRIIEILERL